LAIREALKKPQGPVSAKDPTYNNQIVTLHDQTGRQEHGPENSFLVLAQGGTDRQQSVRRITLLRLVDQVKSLRTTKLQALQLPLGQNNSIHSHDV
jgi:hypothetical protein